MLIKYAEAFIASSALASIKWCVSGVSGAGVLVDAGLAGAALAPAEAEIAAARAELSRTRNAL